MDPRPHPLPVDRPGDRAALRRTLLMVSVLDGVDLTLSDGSIVLTGPAPEGPTAAGPSGTATGVAIGWDEVAWAVQGCEPESPTARHRLRTWLALRAALHALPDPQRRARPVGLPVGHVLHPGRAWVRHRVLGGALEVGVGLLGLLDDPDQVVVPPAGLLAAAGLDDHVWWPGAVRYLEDKGRVAGDRLALDPTGPLRPIGDCDVVTLLASAQFRTRLCGDDPMSLRTAAIPMRRRGWLDLGRVDPAFVVAAAAATDPWERGFDRPVLVTCEEVTVVAEGGRATAQALADQTPTVNAWDRR